jgi:MFS family permease
VFSLGFLVAGMSAPIWGRVTDRRGPRAAFLPGVLLTGLLVADLFGVRALGEVFGLLGLAATVGGAVGGAGAGLLFDLLESYDGVFAIGIALCVIGAVLMLRVRLPVCATSDGAARSC